MEATMGIAVTVVDGAIISIDGGMTYTLQLPANPGDELELVSAGSGQLSYSAVSVIVSKRRIYAQIDTAAGDAPPEGFELAVSVINLSGGGEIGTPQAAIVFTHLSTAYDVLIDGIGNAWANGEISAVLTYLDPMAQLISPVNMVLRLKITDPIY